MMALIVILRVVLGVFWFWAGLSKWIYGFDATAFLQGALVNHAVFSTPYFHTTNLKHHGGVLLHGTDSRI